MSVARIVIEIEVAETRAVALDAAGVALALFHEIDCEPRRARWGETTGARVTACAPGEGGAFLVLESGEEAFLPARSGLPDEGQRLPVRIAAEARAGKLARVAAIDPGAMRAPAGNLPLAHWVAALPGGPDAAMDETPDAGAEIDAAFDEALGPAVPLPGGGRLQVSPTPALTALDVDTAGRRTRGRAAERARGIGVAAAGEAARQLTLRGLGGLAVLDCPGQLSREDGAALKAAFLAAHRLGSTAPAQVLRPSPFGLMEIALEWRVRPLAEPLLAPDGRPSPLAVMLEGLRRLAREAAARRGARLVLTLPEAAFALYKPVAGPYLKAFADRFGHRLQVGGGPVQRPEIDAR